MTNGTLQQLYIKLKLLLLLLQFPVISNFVIASEQELTWSLGAVVSTIDSATESANFFNTYRGYSNTILSNNNTHVTIGLPSPGIAHAPNSPDILYVSGPNNNVSDFSVLFSQDQDILVIVKAIYIYENGMYVRQAGLTFGTPPPGFPELSFIATEIDLNGTPPPITILLHELFHRSGHVYPRVSDPGGHTEDGNIMRAGPRDQDTGITSDQKSWIRSHVETGGYYPPMP